MIAIAAVICMSLGCEREPSGDGVGTGCAGDACSADAYAYSRNSYCADSDAYTHTHAHTNAYIWTRRQPLLCVRANFQFPWYTGSA